MTTHVAAQCTNATVAARDSLPGFPYIDFNGVNRVSQSAAFSRLTLLAYDIILNAPREKELIWSQRWRASTAIYFLIRYPVIAFQIFSVYTSGQQTPQVSSISCDALYKFTWTMSIIPPRIAIIALFALRVYAVMGLTRWGITWATCLVAVGCSSVGLDIWQAIQVSCSMSSNPISTVLTFFSLATFDILATIILLVHSVRLFRESGWQLLRSSRLFSLIVNQGLVYFITVSAVQVAAIVLYYFPQNVFSLIFNNLPLYMSSILLSRFLLDLREHHQFATQGLTNNNISLTEMRFGSRRDASSILSYDMPSGWASSMLRDFDDPEEIVFSSEEHFEDTYWSDATDY